MVFEHEFISNPQVDPVHAAQIFEEIRVTCAPKLAVERAEEPVFDDLIAIDSPDLKNVGRYRRDLFDTGALKTELGDSSRFDRRQVGR
jgi:hypothetical protein